MSSTHGIFCRHQHWTFVQELTLVGSIAYLDSLALFNQLPAQLTLISISTEFVLRHARPAHQLIGHPPSAHC